MAFEVESDMGILTKVVQAKDTLVTHGAAGCLQASAWGRQGTEEGKGAGECFEGFSCI